MRNRGSQRQKAEAESNMTHDTSYKALVVMRLSDTHTKMAFQATGAIWKAKLSKDHAIHGTKDHPIHDTRNMKTLLTGQEAQDVLST